jgi:NitT/TauT family transport system permease protein
MKVLLPAIRRSLFSREFWSVLAVRAAFILLLIILWQIVYVIFANNATPKTTVLFPSPLQVGSSLIAGFRSTGDGNYFHAIAVSLWRLVKGYCIAILIGFPLGLAVARWKLAKQTVGWMSLSLQAMPSIGWAPLAILWFGINSDTPVLFVTVAGSLFATVLAVSGGIEQVPPLLIRAGRTLGAKGPRLYFSVLLPAALPMIVNGLKVGWAFAWRSVLGAELLVTAGGLGRILQQNKMNEAAAGLFATIIVIIAISLIIETLLFAPLERHLRTMWGLETN